MSTKYIFQSHILYMILFLKKNLSADSFSNELQILEAAFGCRISLKYLYSIFLIKIRQGSFYAKETATLQNAVCNTWG